MGETEDERSQASKLFENFVQAPTCKSTLQTFNILCSYLELDPLEHSSFYNSLKSKLTCWKAKALWSKLDKRASHREYKKGKACADTKCLIIGGGPCGLRTAIELALLGAKAVVIEKRDTFSRNNVLHLWPFTIHDLRNLGAKKFYGKFCAGAIDHISIRQLQLMLLKIALLVGVEFHINVEFVKLLEPPEDQENEGPGWRAEIRPADHPVANFDFDVVIGADGRRNTLEGFRRKEFRGKLAIAITANFINRNTTAEAKVDEISGVAFIFNQKFFQDLKQETGIDLENIVYYKDNTHYFVMTAKKQSLLDKGVIIHDYIDTDALLSSENVNQEALLSYAREAADYATHYQLPTLDYAMNHLDQPDVAMFDFTCMYASENAALVRERFGHQLLVALVGDSLLEPFWPMGTGCARGFLAAFDTVWMIRSWSQDRNPLEVLAERESLYRLLPQTTPENIAKNFDQYTIDPGTRYPNLNSNCVRPHQVRNYYICGELKSCSLERAATIRRPVNLARRESEIRPSRLLTWCQKQTEGYKGVSVTDLSSSWRSGLAFCALIHRFRAHLIDYDSLNEEDAAKNAQLAFDVAEKEFGIKPFTTGKEIASEQEQDKNSMVTYLSKFYELFRGTPLPPSDSRRETHENNDECSSRPSQPVYRSLSLTQPRKRIPKDDKKVDDNDSFYKRRRKVCSYLEEVTNISSQRSLASEGQELKENKVKFMASQLLAKFEESNPGCTLRRQSDSNVARPPRPASLDMTETPLFKKPQKKTPPPPPPKRQFQAAVCVRRAEECPAALLTVPFSSPLGVSLKPIRHTYTRSRGEPTHIQSNIEPTQPHTQSYRETSKILAPTKKQLTGTCMQSHAQPPLESPAEAAEASHSASCHSAILAMTAMLQRLQKVEEKISQRKAQTQNTREFHKKSIKEKAVHLSSLFSGDSISQPQASSSSHYTSTLSSPHPCPQSTLTSFASPLLSSSPSLLLHQTDPSAPNFTLHSSSKLPLPHPLPPCTSSAFPSSHRSSSLLVQQNGRDVGHCFSLQKESKMPLQKGYKILTFPNKLLSKTCTSHQPEVQLCENETQKESVIGSNVLSRNSGTSIYNHQKDMELPQLGGDRNIKTFKKTYPSAANPSHSSSALPLPYPFPECIAASTFSFPSSCVFSKPQHLGTLLSKRETQGETQNNSHHSSSSTAYFSLRKQMEVSQSKEDSNGSKQRTVGKVSLVLGARAETLLTLYENDRRPKSACSGSLVSLRREFPQSLGDVCHVCKKRVYMAERLRAEGLFFHSECFRCDTCSTPLSQGGQAFDSEQGKLYCKLHFSQRKFMKCGGIFDTHMPPKGAVHPSTRPSPAGVESSLRQSPGTLSSVLKRSLHWSLHSFSTHLLFPLLI
ncbi:F-actin-monooxygenase MICAL2 isoform X5 [Pygocentrus nattereri]|uniref:F-actin-monooxygenase MICAL2 isoform X5 n=1 Tax=Pygocentrus nattereri TaxID=42514 RepID=UPI0008147DAB|nr:F-actin-monooxygenase MICAL2 isoform X5 [Pygocentrus nattereri]XP_017562732.1 F-actin-monooxygenase MICAL2 isoform X5 [Pygocentrus nattereri]